jgi:D-alanine-D-alanine ligase
MIEEYVDGPEYTVLVAADPNDPLTPLVYTPIEFLFDEQDRFKTYALKVETHHPERNVAVADSGLARALQHAAREIFLGFDGEGYARLDFRSDTAGILHFLDINFTCSVFYPEGSEGSADYILRHHPAGPAGFLRHIIVEGLARHRRRQRCTAL